jgi:hypothetical protein
MNDPIQLDQIRELFINAPESDATRVLAVLGSMSLMAIVLWLVRRRSLREEHTPIWIAIAACLTLVSVIPGLLQAITRAIGAWTPSSTLFFLGEACLVVLCLNFAVRLSRAGVQIKTLGQELAVLRARVDDILGPRNDPKRMDDSGSMDE